MTETEIMTALAVLKSVETLMNSSALAPLENNYELAKAMQGLDKELTKLVNSLKKEVNK